MYYTYLFYGAYACVLVLKICIFTTAPHNHPFISSYSSLQSGTSSYTYEGMIMWEGGTLYTMFVVHGAVVATTFMFIQSLSCLSTLFASTISTSF